MKSICVFCGSSRGSDPVYESTTIELARSIVDLGLTLIYGGGSIGLMGVLADEVLSLKGRVVGIIPKFLYDLEVGHDGLSELIIVESMHKRKEKMADISDSFLALPGGFGTLEEMSEILTWIQLKLVKKPIGLLNINGFYDQFLVQLDHMVRESFLKSVNRNLLLSSGDPKTIISLLKNSCGQILSESSDLDKT